MVTECKRLSYPELALKGNVDESKNKLYYPDTGLLVPALDEEAQEDLRQNKNLGVYKGALYENFIAEAFIKQGLDLAERLSNQVYYYDRETRELSCATDNPNKRLDQIVA